MISQLSAKYQFGAIHTLTQRILDTNRALLYATGGIKYYAYRGYPLGNAACFVINV